MKRLIFVIAVGLLLPINLSAQKRFEEYDSKLQFRVGVGATLSMTSRFGQKKMVDSAFDYSDNSLYIQVINIGYFPWKRFGFELNMRNQIPEYGRHFDRNVKAEYAGYRMFDSKEELTTNNCDWDFLFVYRYEKNRFYIYPKLSVGAVALGSKGFKYTFKKDDSNELYQVFYKRSRPNVFFAYGASVSTGYKLSRRVYLNFDFSMNFYQTKFSIEKETTQLSTGTVSIESFYYKRKTMAKCHIGAGVIVVLKKSKKPIL